jgi:hypothetical protein
MSKTFDTLFLEHNLTSEERKKLIIFLAVFRATKTIDMLLLTNKPVTK